MRITRTRLNQIINEERMWLEVHTGGLGPGRNRKHDEEVRPTIELEEDDDLGMPADAEAQEADEEAAETDAAAPYATGQNVQKEEIMKMVREELGALMNEDDDWIQKAVDPEHEGYCTPMTKKTCTPERKALAKRFKKAAKKKKREGGTGWQGKV
jgi:hypothetical protein